MINFQFFPRSHGVTPEIQVVIDCFKKIEATLADGQHRVSNDVLALLRPHLEACGYDVEKGKGRDEKIDVPVLFGENNEIDKSFYADAVNREHRIVIEVEAGRAVRTNQFLKDIFQACMMFDIEYLVIAVLNEYTGGAKRAHKFNSKIDASVEIFKLGSSYWMNVYNALMKEEVLSYGDCDFIRSIASYIGRGSLPSPAQCRRLLKVIEKAEDKGYIMP